MPRVGCHGRADGHGTWQSYMVAPEANLEGVPDGISDQDAAQFAVRAETLCVREARMLRRPWRMAACAVSEQHQAGIVR